MKPIIRPAIIKDLEEFYPDESIPTVKAWVGEVDGKLVAIGGYSLVQGRWYAFLDVNPEGRRYKITIIKTARMIMEKADEQGIKYLYVQADENEPSAKKWLYKLGFRHNSNFPNLLMREAK